MGWQGRHALDRPSLLRGGVEAESLRWTRGGERLLGLGRQMRTVSVAAWVTGDCSLPAVIFCRFCDFGDSQYTRCTEIPIISMSGCPHVYPVLLPQQYGCIDTI